MKNNQQVEQGIGTIYHEIGHLFGYILANNNDDDYLGEVIEITKQ